MCHISHISKIYHTVNRLQSSRSISHTVTIFNTANGLTNELTHNIRTYWSASQTKSVIFHIIKKIQIELFRLSFIHK